ncbi:hypothetical protein BH24ACT2_BH24ACT2_03910 [soil metagenome]
MPVSEDHETEPFDTPSSAAISGIVHPSERSSRARSCSATLPRYPIPTA